MRESVKKQEEQERSSRQDQEADLYLEGGRVLNVYSGEILESNVAVKGEKIWYAGPRSDPIGERTLRLDMSCKVLVPGYNHPRV
jgi:adenine deaminase